MSDTPRTDANLGKHLTSTGFPVVDPTFARQLERELNEAKRDAARYEVVRRMNPTDFALMYQRCLHMDLRFDDEVDRLAATRTVKMHLKVKEDER